MAGRMEPSDIQFDERKARHNEAKVDEAVLDSLKSFQVDITESMQ